jgi:hypothetical protein
MEGSMKSAYRRREYRWPRPWPAAGVLLICVAVAVIGSNSLSQFEAGVVHGNQQAGNAVPVYQVGALPEAVCGNRAVLGGGPRFAQAHAVTVPDGDDFSVDFSQPDTTYWFAPGVHTLGTSEYAQVIPARGSVYIGAPGAVLDGEHENDYAFGGYATDVTISYLTVENFGAEGGNQNQGVVNHNSAAGWTIDHSTITRNAGAGVMLGSGDTLSYDCLSDNQQYGFSAYSPSVAPAGLVLDHNQITGNDTYNWEARVPGCGCSGGGKFWDVDGAMITDNWISDNQSAGLWADTNNRGFEIKGNYFTDNYSYGLIYEISYNALIEDNTFVRNGIGEGPHNPGFPTSAIYISESGSDSRVPGKYNQDFEISGNKFVNNWGGVILWEDANRFCNSPSNTSTGTCTLVDPSVVTIQTCGPRNIDKSPYFDDCRWKVQNVLVNHNVFDFDPTAVGPSCTPQDACGFQGLFSEFGTWPLWSPYKGTVVEEHITFDQDNHFSDNTYNGPWQFMAVAQGNIVSWWNWQSSPYDQDQGSTLNPHGF